MRVLDGPTHGLVRAAASIPVLPLEPLTAVLREARAEGTSTAWLDELVLAAVLFAGFPRGLVAAGALRTVEPLAGEVGDAADYSAWREWERRGVELCRRIYGPNYEKLRENVRGLHPALDAWIIMDGYGRTLSRPALDPVRREFCSIALLIPQDTPHQLHSHLRGALNVGATPEQVDDVLSVAAECSEVPRARLAAARSLWDGVRGVH